MLQRALARLFGEASTDVVCENIGAFYLAVEASLKLQDNTSQHYYLVLDRVDKLLPGTSELLSVFGRLPEIAGIVRLTTILVYNTPEPKALISSPIPHVYFPRYELSETVSIISARNFGDAPEGFWQEFVRVAVTILNTYTGTDIRLLRRLLRRIWPSFADGAAPEWNFLTQYKMKEKLFMTEDFIDRLSPSPPDTPQLSSIAKYMLCAAYLVSYNPPRYDVRFFSRAKEARAKRRDTKPRAVVEIPARSLPASTFECERLLAVLHSLLPNADSFVSDVSVGTELATLKRFKMIERIQGDALDSRAKWKINVPWLFVQQIADDIQLPIQEYILE